MGNPAVPSQPVSEIVALAQARLQQAEADQSIVDSTVDWWVGEGKFTPLEHELAHVQELPDTPENRVRARSLLTSLGGTLPDTPPILQPDAGDVMARDKTVADEAAYFASNPGEGVKVSTGWRDVAGSPGVTQRAAQELVDSAKQAVDSAEQALNDAKNSIVSGAHHVAWGLGIFVAIVAAGGGLVWALRRGRDRKEAR